MTEAAKVLELVCNGKWIERLSPLRNDGRRKERRLEEEEVAESIRRAAWRDALGAWTGSTG